MDKKTLKTASMADVRLLVQEEGRAARNLIAFNVPLETDNVEKITRKPPSVPKVLQPPNAKRSIKSNARLRSASTGRDKRSELQARYWAFLFGNLQRAVDAIYETCEEDENITECKEVILVLENYTRDFHNLIEWFKVKWAYETSPPPLRRTPLAWEVRKTSPCRMWNSCVVSKPTSPLQRISPTSPVDQVIVENEVVTHENRTEPVVGSQTKSDVLKNTKIVKECKNKNSRDDGKTLKEKNTTVTSTKLSSRAPPANVFKRTVTSKSQENDNKVLTENNANIVKTSVDTKSNNLSRSTHRSQQTTINRTKSANLPASNIINNENNVDGLTKKNTEAKKDIEITKNQINTSLSKNCAINGLRTTLSCISNKSSNKSATSTVPKAKTNNSASTAKPAYSTVSRMKTTLNMQTTTTQQQQPQPEIPKMVRSKTTLGVRGATAPNRMKPGTSVIVRKRPQTQAEYLRKRSSINSEHGDMSASVEVLHPQSKASQQQESQQQSTSPPPTTPKEDVDGWQTVRGRYRRSSTHNLNMSTRFHKPSTATSLPALCIDSPTDKNRQRSRRSAGAKLTKVATANDKPEGKAEGERQRVDGRNAGDGKHVDQQQQQQQQAKGESPASKSSEVSANGETTSPKVIENQSTSLTIAAIFKSEAELLEKRIQQFMAAQAERERIILEEERKTEEADSQRSKQLSDEEALLQRQILELESTDIDVDTETDETDGEMVLDTEDDALNVEASSDVDPMSLEDRYENMLEGMSWAERMDTLAQLQALVARHPGRAIELHQKLSSPSRKRSLPETLRRYQAKQACAQHKRQKLLMEKSQRLRELLNKVEDVKSAKHQLIEDKRLRLEQKLKRAEEKRTQHLLEIVRKAHDEESKLKEIAFINELEAQNKRHDFMALCQEQEERLQGIQEERQRRQEEKAAKEAAAEERRRALEAERQLRIQRMRQVRREREERVGKMQLEREKERQELAREKARDREERLSALHAAQLANQEELQKKIAQKQQDSARRHVENIEHIRQRALESSITRSEELPPTLKRYPCPKQCLLCTRVIPNEVHLLSHLKGRPHSEAVRRVHEGREPSRDELQKFNISQIKDLQQSSSQDDENRAAKERQKALKRRSRKIKQRMLARSLSGASEDSAVQNVADSANKANFRRNLKELDKLCQAHARSAWSSAPVASLERCLGQIARAFSKACPLDQDTFAQLGGFETLTNLLNLALNIQNASQTLPNKSIVSICRVYVSGLNGHRDNIETVLLGNKIIVILDLLMQRLEVVTSLDDSSQAQEVASTNTSSHASVVSGVLQLLCTIVPEAGFDKPSLQSRIQDLTSYLLTSGLIERLSRHSRAMIESDYLLQLDQERDCSLLVNSYDLLSRVCSQLKRTPAGTVVPTNAEIEASASESGSESSVARAHLLNQLESSEAAGLIGTLYAAVTLSSTVAGLQKAVGSSSSSASPTPNQFGLSSAGRLLAFNGLRLLKNVAELDLAKYQALLGAEGTNLQWRLIASHLITKLSRDIADQATDQSASGVNNRILLSELFIALGYFAINNIDNQLVLQSSGGGATGPSVLQQLCTLPFPYYGDPQLASFTLPTLLAATHDNVEAKAVLTCEMSYQLLEEYRDSEPGKFNPLVRLLKVSSTA